MRFKSHLLLLLALCIAGNLFAQEEDLLAGLEDDKPKKEKVFNAFKSSRVIMSHSMEMLRPGILDFRILHRFGNINQGVSELFGLDNATIRLGLDYAVSDFLTVGIGRGTYNKEVDGFIKLRPIQQATGPKSLPFSLLIAGGATVKTTKWTDPTRKNYFSNRMGYYGQVILGRKFSEAFTLQFMPTVVHRNLVFTTDDPNDVFAAGVGGRLKLSKRISLNVDYYYVVNQEYFYTSQTDRLDRFNPLSIGFDIETGGHVFQLHFTNAVGMNERVFLTETINDWANGDIQFGFNISRAFQIKKKK